MTVDAARNAVVLHPVGWVVSPDSAEPVEIEIAPEFAGGLEGVEQHGHLWILYWMHRLSDADRRILRAHPKGDAAQPKRGVFALHSPMRPNPIGMTRVRLLRRCGNRLLVEGLDALEGSPVLDIRSG